MEVKALKEVQYTVHWISVWICLSLHACIICLSILYFAQTQSVEKDSSDEEDGMMVRRVHHKEWKDQSYADKENVSESNMGCVLKSIEKFSLEQRLPSAIDNDEFILHYQPKSRLSDYRVVGLEALIRWAHPEQALIFPGDFIDIAEETGLIINLGNWVLHRACKQLKEWKNQGLTPLPIAINVSPQELRDAKYADNFFQTLGKYDIAPHLIEIEITENAIIEDRVIVGKNLNLLADQQVTISLDDYGKGFSSIDTLRSFPMHALKIDRSFIQDIRNIQNDNAIVYSTIVLAQRMNMKVVAEGVETHEQLMHLKLAGCDYVQGYLLSRPVPEEQARKFVISPSRSVEP